jgi:hypothetical protein
MLKIVQYHKIILIWVWDNEVKQKGSTCCAFHLETISVAPVSSLTFVNPLVLFSVHVGYGFISPCFGWRISQEFLKIIVLSYYCDFTPLLGIWGQLGGRSLCSVLLN